MVHRYCRELAKLLNGNQFQGPTKIYHYTCSNNKAKLTNACFLMCAFMVVILKLDAEHSFSLFKQYQSSLAHYRDASKGDCYYELTIIHCLQGLQEALKHGWYNFRTFNVKEYEHYEKVENGDLNWIIPGKFMAFMGPVDIRDNQHRYGHSAASYINIFKHLKVGKVVRLNDPKYDHRSFENKGIEHEDMFFVDGSTPPQPIVDQFISSCEAYFA